jgi:hypothetical protein
MVWDLTGGFAGVFGKREELKAETKAFWRISNGSGVMSNEAKANAKADPPPAAKDDNAWQVRAFDSGVEDLMGGALAGADGGMDGAPVAGGVGVLAGEE